MDQPAKNVFADAAPADGGERGRDSMFLMARLRLVGASETHDVRVRNLSSGGLMAELADPIDTDAPIEIEVRGIGWITGRVAWQTEGRAGISFDRPIDPQRARKPFGAGNDSKTFGLRR